MALQPPIPVGGKLTQKFGPSLLSVEPAMFGNLSKAAWSAESGLIFYKHFHPALDIGAAYGTLIVASEAGKVLYAGDNGDGGGKRVSVQIRPGVVYSNNHCSGLTVATGATVARGQRIAYVGHSGLAQGDHDHFWLQIDEIVSGVVRHNFQNPTLFLPGGALASDARILPITVVQNVQLNAAAECNIRTAPQLALSTIFAVADTSPSGIYRLGVRIAAHDVKMRFGGWVNGDGYTWAKCYLGGGYRFIARQFIHFA